MRDAVRPTRLGPFQGAEGRPETMGAAFGEGRGEKAVVGGYFCAKERPTTYPKV